MEKNCGWIENGFLIGFAAKGRRKFIVHCGFNCALLGVINKDKFLNKILYSFGVSIYVWICTLGF